MEESKEVKEANPEWTTREEGHVSSEEKMARLDLSQVRPERTIERKREGKEEEGKEEAPRWSKEKGKLLEETKGLKRQIAELTEWKARQLAQQKEKEKRKRQEEEKERENTRRRQQEDQAKIQQIEKEVDRRNQAIQQCGDEILDLRKKLRASQEEVDQYKERILEVENAEKEREEALIQMLTRSPAEPMDEKTQLLVVQLATLTRTYQQLQKANSELQEKSKAHQKDIEMFDSVKATYHRLEKAHLQQGEYIQKLQKAISRTEKYKETIEMQEKIISKLENVIQSNLPRENNARDTDNLKANVNTAVIEDPQTQIPDQQREIQKLREENERLVESMNVLSASKEGMEEMKDQNERSTIRVQALEKQLQDNAREYAIEIVKLKQKLYDYEMGLTDIAMETSRSTISTISTSRSNRIEPE